MTPEQAPYAFLRKGVQEEKSSTTLAELCGSEKGDCPFDEGGV
jgi:hypothetical protein